MRKPSMNMRNALQLRKLYRCLIAVSVAVTVASCATISTGCHFDEEASFDRYQTFSWISEAPFLRGATDSVVPISPLTHRKIEHAVEQELQRKGYEHLSDPANADLLIAYTLWTREKTVANYPDYYAAGRDWHDRRYYVPTVVRRSYTKGTLGIDIFDAHTGNPIWHGWAEKAITDEDRQNPTPMIEVGVEKLLVDFPTRQTFVPR